MITTRSDRKKRRPKLEGRFECCAGLAVWPAILSEEEEGTTTTPTSKKKSAHPSLLQIGTTGRQKCFDKLVHFTGWHLKLAASPRYRQIGTEAIFCEKWRVLSFEILPSRASRSFISPAAPCSSCRSTRIWKLLTLHVLSTAVFPQHHPQ